MLGLASDHVVRQRHARDPRTGRFVQRSPEGVLRMTEREDLRERVAVLESQGKHMTQKIDSMDKKLNEVHEILVAARGARWVVLTMAAAAGFVIGKIGELAPGLFK